MGANHSSHKNPNSAIVVELKTSKIYSGDCVSGLIHIYLSESLPKCDLQFVFKGKEVTNWTNNDEEHRFSFHGKKRVCYFSQTLKSWNEGLPHGSYSVPFQFTTPPNLPNSFDCSKVDFNANITYKIAAILSESSQKLKGSSTVSILQQVSSINIDLSLRKTIKLKDFGCISKGTLNLCVHCPQDTYSPTQHLSCMVEIDNSNSKLKVASITANLKCSIRLLSNQHNLYAHTYNLLSNNYPISVQPGQAFIDSNSIKLDLNLQESNQLISCYSTKGSLIECTYFVEILVHVNNWVKLCTESHSIDTVCIIAPNTVIHKNEDIIAPDDWNPFVFESVSFHYMPEFEIDKPIKSGNNEEKKSLISNS